MQHLSDETLEAYAMGQVAGAELEGVEEHLYICDTCMNQLEAVERYTRAMQGAAKRVREEQYPLAGSSGIWERVRAWFPAPVPIWTGAFAMIALIVMIGLNLDRNPGPPVEVELVAVRGTTVGTAPAGHAFHLQMDGTGIPQQPAWPIEIVDDGGTSVWKGTGTLVGSRILAAADRSFTPGTYFVRLLRPNGDPVREYQLVVSNSKP